MPIAAPRSLLNPYPEPLPLYTPRQTAPNEWETASIRSSAPSYVSAAPSYHSSAPPHHIRASDIVTGPDNYRPREDNRGAASSSEVTRQGTGLPSPQPYAPGFETRGGDLSHTNIRSLYSISEWVPVTGGLQARHYHNVASRRVTDVSRNILPALMPVVSEPASAARIENASVPDGLSRRYTASSLATNTGGMYEENHNMSSASLVNNHLQEATQAFGGSSVSLGNYPWRSVENLPFSPFEDPDLVGEAAAARFRSQRIYRALQQEENLHQQQLSAAASGSQQQDQRQQHVYHYSSLITDADNPRTSHQRPSTAPGLSTEPSSSTDSSESSEAPSASTTTTTNTPNTSNTTSSSPTNPSSRANTRPRANTAVDYDEIMYAQESRTWDFMLAQMADWEERQRSWKKFKEEVDRRLIRNGWGVLSSSSSSSISGGSGGKRKLKKEQFGNHPGGLRKWKSKVGLAN